MGTFVFLHGWQGSEQGHWQRLTATEIGGGHLNVASGYGAWPAVLAWCERSGGF